MNKDGRKAYLVFPDPYSSGTRERVIVFGGSVRIRTWTSLESKFEWNSGSSPITAPQLYEFLKDKEYLKELELI